MLYLEDYLEMIEHLPAELKDRFTEMREMDLSVQNRVDSLEQRQKQFFGSCRKLKPVERTEEFNRIRAEYDKVIEDSSEKISNAEDCYNLVDRYLRKLDQELHKFKLELEADNRGITEVLEKRSLELDAPQQGSSKENRMQKKHVKKNQTIAHSFGGGVSGVPSPATPGGAMGALGGDPLAVPGGSSSSRRSFALSGSDSSLAGMDTTLFGQANIGSASPYALGPMGNPLAAAASAAIAATQNIGGRRTGSLKASYEAVQGGDTHAFTLGGAVQQGEGGRKHKGQKRQYGDAHGGGQQSVLDVVTGAAAALGGSDDPAMLGGEGGGIGGDEDDDEMAAGGAGAGGGAAGEEWYDPNEPRYCVCNQVSYGDMVACDNDDCPYEWFHYPCVGITAPPKGKWYCPTCLARRKGGRK